MLKVIRELGVKVGLYFDKRGAEDADKRINQIAVSMRRTALEVAAASASVFGFAKAAAYNSRELGQYSDALGISAERLQELEYAARVTSGVSRDELVGALESVSSTLDDVRRGNLESAYTFNRLGIGMDVVGNRAIRADQVLMRVATQLQKIPDPIARTAIATQVFGGAGARLLPMLLKGADGIAQMGAEGRKLGVIIGRDAVAEGRKFDQTLSRIWIVLKNVSYTIGYSLLKYLEPLVNRFQSLVVQNKRFIALGLAGVLKSIAYYLELVFKAAGFVANRIQFLVEKLGGLERVSKGVAIALGLITSIRIVSGLGKVLSLFKLMGGVMSGLLSPTTLWTAALLAALLIAQDLFSDDSMLKEWFSKFEKKFPNMAGMARDFVGALVDGAKLILEGWKLVFGLFDEKAPNLKGMATSLLDAAESAAKWIRSGAIGDKIYDLVHPDGAAQAVTPSRSTVAPSLPGAAGAAGGGAKTEFNANMTVMVPPGTSPRAAQSMVSDGAQEAFEAMLRQTRNQAVGGVAY